MRVKRDRSSAPHSYVAFAAISLSPPARNACSTAAVNS